VCPKYVTEQTPEPCREWLAAINDTLDEEVDETLYQRREIHKLFEHIRQDRISPEERAGMIEEYHYEELHQAGFDEGKLFAAKGMLKKGISHEIIAEITGISIEELRELTDV
jgi:predicted transposase/invertase (TIGR01784 family)